MFVRTKDGKIFDCYVSEQMGKPIYYPKHSKTNGYIDWNEVYKKSENIIDILEVGDYVNGGKVIEIEKNYKFIDNEIRDILWLDKKRNDAVWKETIKSIVTRQQFSQISYNLPKDK